MMIGVPKVHCQHIADYYQYRWENHKCIAFNLLRRGYGQCAKGVIELGVNNLYGTHTNDPHGS